MAVPGAFQGSTDTLSVGLGGWIVLAFTTGRIVDGADFTVFENPFLAVGLVTGPPFAEHGTVCVSDDGRWPPWHRARAGGRPSLGPG
jgi:hypothetical protein